MSLRTLERDAPSSFKHSVSAGTRVLVFSAVALVLMLADARLKIYRALAPGRLGGAVPAAVGGDAAGGVARQRSVVF